MWVMYSMVGVITELKSVDVNASVWLKPPDPILSYTRNMLHIQYWASHKGRDKHPH